ncbi:MAG TPA: DUF2339 domain-containing protein [Fimbriimonadaceae bacterium]|nr:DUF2339 domain-containing protein [Fimbriimonadaceae bacterium]
MDDRDTERIVSRLLKIEQKLEDLDRRLTLIEPSPTYARHQWPGVSEPAAAPPPPPPPTPAEPPPVIARPLAGWEVPATPEPEPPVETLADEPPAPEPHAPEPVAPVVLSTPPKGPTGDDLEYKIGRIGLLWAGAVVVVIGFLYLAALAAAHTVWTPQMKFGGAVALCLALIVLGFIKRNEREEFGQILTGIGSCGLYITFAGGQAYSNLYSGRTTVELFVLLSLANLGYAAWRSSRSFLALGMIGGLVAAMLPMHDYNAELDVGLHFVILVPSALIIARNRFVDMAAWLWAASTLALLPIYTYTNHVWELRVGALYADALLCAFLYGFVHRDWKVDPKCGLPAAIVCLAGVGGVAIEGVKNGSLHVFSLVLGAAAGGWLLRDRVLARNSLYAGALAVAVTLAPMGYTRTEAALAFSVLSIGLSLGSLRLAGNLMRTLACVEVALAASAYLGFWLENPQTLPLGNEVAVPLAMMAAIVVGAVCAIRAGLSAEGSVAVGVALTLPLFERLGLLAFGGAAAGATAVVSFFFTTLIAYAMLFALTRWRGLAASLVFCWLLYISLIGLYVGYTASTPYAYAFDLSMTVCLIAVGVLQAVITRPKLQPTEAPYLVFGSGAMAGVFLVRFVYVLLLNRTSFSPSSAITLGALICTVVALALHWRFKSRELLYVSLSALGAGLCILWPMSQWEESGIKHEMLLSLAAVGVSLLCGMATARTVSGTTRDLSIASFGLVMGGTWMRFLFLVLTVSVPHELRLADTRAFAVGALTWFAVALVGYYRRKEEALIYLAWVAAGLFLGAAIPPAGVLDIDHQGLRLEAAMLIIALAVPLVLVRATATATKERIFLTAVPIALNWMSFTRLCLHWTNFPEERANAVVSLAWTAYAMILIALGFGYRAPYIRYWALAIFGTVLVKVFLIDLANVEAAIRVAVLLFLGLCMVAAGYGYVRWKQAKPGQNLV